MRKQKVYVRLWGHTTTMGSVALTNLRKPEYTGICDGRPGDVPRFGSGELSSLLYIGKNNSLQNRKKALQTKIRNVTEIQKGYH